MPRITGAALARQSARLGHSCVILASRIWREIGRSMFESTSAMPNRPITTGTRPMPS